ncbi:MAG TPA: glycosyltransferase [Kineosporiaceae bacterium]|nr:glycosyltransferase [Kineosporiaceae bacterium]
MSGTSSPRQDPGPQRPDRPRAGVVIPAHNEEQVIARTLSRLLAGAEPGDLAVVVAANACTDGTVGLARGFAGVDVLDLPAPGKPAALAAGDTRLDVFPRIYLDADVDLDTASALALADRLRAGDMLAAAPRRVLDLSGCSWPVRAYYRMWEQLPSVQQGLFGRGAIAVSEAGHAALNGHAGVVNDDGRADALLRERSVVVPQARVSVRCPRTTAALLRRRARTARGNTELRRLGTGATSTADTVREVVRIVLARPRLLPAAVVFAVLTVAGRFVGRRQRRRGSTAWGRDDSSRD